MAVPLNDVAVLRGLFLGVEPAVDLALMLVKIADVWGLPCRKRRRRNLRLFRRKRQRAVGVIRAWDAGDDAGGD